MRTCTRSLLLALLACIGQDQNPAEANAEEIIRAKIPADTSLSYIVVPYDTTYFRLFPRRGTAATGYKPTELASTEIDACYDLILQHLEEYNVEHGGNKIDPSAYCFQYTAAVSYKGEKIAYINAMCRSFVEQMTSDGEHLNWKTALIEVEDGGECFFQIVIHLDLMRILRFSVNGYAWKNGINGRCRSVAVASTGMIPASRHTLRAGADADKIRMRVQLIAQPLSFRTLKTPSLETPKDAEALPGVPGTVYCVQKPHNFAFLPFPLFFSVVP